MVAGEVDVLRQNRRTCRSIGVEKGGIKKDASQAAGLSWERG